MEESKLDVDVFGGMVDLGMTGGSFTARPDLDAPRETRRGDPDSMRPHESHGELVRNHAGDRNSGSRAGSPGSMTPDTSPSRRGARPSTSAAHSPATTRLLAQRESPPRPTHLWRVSELGRPALSAMQSGHGTTRSSAPVWPLDRVAQHTQAQVRRLVSGPGGAGLLGLPVTRRSHGPSSSSRPGMQGLEHDMDPSSPNPESIGPPPFNPTMMAEELAERSRRHQRAVLGAGPAEPPLLSFVGRVDIMQTNSLVPHPPHIRPPAGGPSRHLVSKKKHKHQKEKGKSAVASLFTTIPSQCRCPIMLELMKDPVVAEDGFTYERSAIERWLATKSISPCTGAVMRGRHVLPNNSMRSLCSQIRDEIAARGEDEDSYL